MAENKMVYRFLGKSGLKVSELCLGTWMFGPRSDGLLACTEKQSHELLDKFVENGGNFIDTADVYGKGKSEEIIGKWLARQDREKLVIATKVRGQLGDGPNDVGLSRHHIMEQVEGSLRRLQTHYIDLYQIHTWDCATPIEETLSALNDLVRIGKVRYVGGSNLLGWHLQKIVDICEKKGYDHWITLQQEYNLLRRQSELDAFDVCANEGIGILPYGPLQQGMLSGKFRRDTDVSSMPDSRIGWATITKSAKFSQIGCFKNDKTWSIIDKLEDIGQKYGKTIAQVSIRWLLEKDNVSSVIFGAKNIQQLMDNLGASGQWGLTQQEVQELDELSAPDVNYPYEMVRRQNMDRHRP